MSAPIIPDGSFETPAIAATTWGYAPSGSPWTFSPRAGIATANSGWGTVAPVDGNQYLLLQYRDIFSDPISTVTQTITFGNAGTYLVVGQACQLSGGIFDIQIDGVVVGTVDPTDVSAWHPWQSQPFEVTAGPHSLALVNNPACGTGDHTVLIDSLQFVALSESANVSTHDFQLPTENQSTKVVTLGAQTFDALAVSWASLTTSGLTGQIEAHLAAESAAVADQLRTLYRAAGQAGPLARARTGLDTYVNGGPIPVLNLISDLTLAAYGLTHISAALNEVAAFLATVGDTIPITHPVPVWTPEDPDGRLMPSPHRQVPRS